MDFSSVIATFGRPDTMTAYETAGEYVLGRWTPSAPQNSSQIQGVILQEPILALALDGKGSMSDGTVCLHTFETLYWIDTETASTEDRQSFVIWGGYTWRVVGTGQMLGNVSSNLYRLARYYDNTVA